MEPLFGQVELTALDNIFFHILITFKGLDLGDGIYMSTIMINYIY